MKHLNIEKLKKLTPYQKTAIGAWNSAKDPSIYAFEDFDYTKAQEFTRKMQNEKGIKLTPTYIIFQAVSLMASVRPQLNMLLRGRQLYQRKKTSISCLVSIDTDQDIDSLACCVVHDTSQLDMMSMYKTLKRKIEKIKKNQDEIVQAQHKFLGRTPSPFIKYILNTLSFLGYTLNLRFKSLPHDPFGSVMISNLGQMGIDQAFAPLVDYSRAPFIAALGCVQPRPVVLPDRTLAVRDSLRINCTIDHRYIDGKSLSVMRKMLIHILSNPQRWLLPSPQSIKEEFLKDFHLKKWTNPS